VTTASSYLSASDKRVLVGLGGDSRARSVEVRWPSGTVQKMTDVPVGRQLTIKEADGR
jgi:hypothetical protein